MATKTPFNLNTSFDPNWEETSAQEIFLGIPEQEQQTAERLGLQTTLPEKSELKTPDNISILARAGKQVSGEQTEMEGSDNPLYDLKPPEPVQQAKEDSVGTGATYGQVIRQGFNIISRLKELKSTKNGRNRAEIGAIHSIYDSLIADVRNSMGQYFEDKEYDRGLVDVLGKSPGGGLRDAKEIDRLFEIQKNGTSYQDPNGQEIIVAPNSDWQTVLDADRVSRAMALKGQKPGKEVDSNKMIGELFDNYKKALDNLKSAQETNTPELISMAQAGVDLYGSQLNQATGGSFYRNQHSDIQKNILTALNNANNPKVNWQGVSYDKVDQTKPETAMTGNDYLSKLATEGSIPTISIKDGVANTSAADDFLKKYGVENTTAGIWEGNNLKLYTYNPSESTPLKPILGKSVATNSSEIKTKYDDAAKEESSKIEKQNVLNEINSLRSDISNLTSASENVSGIGFSTGPAYGGLTFESRPRLSAVESQAEARKILQKREAKQTRLNELQKKYPDFF